ncbi:MAG TPA: trypsin-like peptidase domain-containing protein [Planctomycetota bacterium]|nr:trypsin-like peptidase domain-containing protein [Planctomycetota bacterium]
MSSLIQPIAAGVFHVGSTCPFCQETVAAGQLIVTCPQCSSIHHETCWMHKGGCSSYHCDTAVRGNAAVQRAEIVINAAELANVYVPPPAPKRGAQEVAAAFLPKKPERLSRLAIVSAALAVFSLIGLLGAVTSSVSLLTMGVMLAVSALIAGIISLLFINNTNNRISGMPLAGGSVLSMLALIVLYFACIGMNVHRHTVQQQVDLRFAENRYSEAQLEAMSAPLRNAMRANVVIQSGSTFGETRYGSGIVLSVKNNRAIIMTNKHVIGDQKTGITAQFYNDEHSTATVEWLAPKDIDIALLSCRVLTLSKYKPAEIDEGHVGPGEKVFAVGNPMGLAWSYTEGTISSLRTSQGGEGAVELYQTQTPINSGNSGGGLYTMDGTLIGVNTLTHDKATSEGLSFAITSAAILKLLTPAERDKYFEKIKADKQEKKAEKDDAF